jgi:hypothetical protein
MVGQAVEDVGGGEAVPFEGVADVGADHALLRDWITKRIFSFPPSFGKGENRFTKRYQSVSSIDM